MDPTEILEGASDGDDTAVSMVLHNHDLLLDIMLRFDLHTSLARSIFVCKRWSFVAADPFLLRWFRRQHPPRLLGFYVATRSTTTHILLRPRFVPMPPEFYQSPPPPPESDQPPPESDQPQPTESDQPPPPESDQPQPTESDQPPPPESDQPPPPESDQPQPTESDQPPPPESDQPQPTESDQPPPPESNQPPPPESDQPQPTESDQPPAPESDQPPPPEELDAAVRLVESYRGLDAYDEDFACICDLQNDTMLVSGFYGKGCPALEVHWPMSPHRGVVPVPVIPLDLLDDPACTAATFILKVDQGGRDSLVYVWLSMAFLVNRPTREYSVKYKAHIYLLQDDGQWRFRASAAAVLPSPKSDSNPVLIGTKIYLEHKTSIAALDLKTSTFSKIPLPEGMEKYDYKDMMLAPVNDDVGIFLVHLDEDLQLCMWLHIDHIGPGWVLIDVVSLPEMFETLGMTGWTDYGEPATLLQTTQTGDFLEFVFLKLGQCAFCFDTRRRVLRKVYEVLRKVYEVTQEDQALERIHPFMMTWPPKFPKLKGDHRASPNKNAS